MGKQVSDIVNPWQGVFYYKNMLIKYLLLALSTTSAIIPSSYGLNSTTALFFKEPEVAQTAVEVQKEIELWVTAYSSTPEQTDDTPFITASGTTVRDGIVATNLLPFGTKVQIPDVFGDKVFVVEDRMHSRKVNNLDIWMETYNEAKYFGAHYTKILVLK